MAENLKSKVYLCRRDTFKIGATKETATTIADATTFKVEIEMSIDEWIDFTTGKKRRMVVTEGVKVTIDGKRNYEDEGNNFLCDTPWNDAEDGEFYFECKLPNGSVIEMPSAVAEVSNIGFGDGDPNKAGTFNAVVYSNGDFTFNKPNASVLGE